MTFCSTLHLQKSPTLDALQITSQQRIAFNSQSKTSNSLLFAGNVFSSYQDQGLSNSSLQSAETLLEVRASFPNEPNDDKLLKLLSLHSPWLNDFIVRFGFVGLSSKSISVSSLLLATTNWVMLQRQKGQTGVFGQALEELGLLWQQRARMQWAHIWWPQCSTSIVHTCSKQMEHSSASLAYVARNSTFQSSKSHVVSNLTHHKVIFHTSDSSSVASAFAGGWVEQGMCIKIAFSLFLLASIRADSNSAFASGLSSPINFNGDGQVNGSGANGFNNAAHASCLYFMAIMYGIFLHSHHGIESKLMNEKPFAI